METYSSEQYNPLYEKLYNRFSYSGMTVGEMMLSRAKEGGTAKGKRHVLSDLTAEDAITYANHLPRTFGSTSPACAVAVASPYSVRRMPTVAYLSLFLLLTVLSCLMLFGIRGGSLTESTSPSFDGIALYERTLDSGIST